MLDASLAFFWCDGMIAHTFAGDDKPRGQTLYEAYRLWETADGHLMYFAATDSEFEGLFRAVGHPEWNDDPRFCRREGRRDPENAAELGGLLMAAIQSITTKQCIERMVEEDVPVGPVLELDELFDDEQIRHNDAILEFDHPTAGRFRQARPAARFDKTPQDPLKRMPPLLGEHTEEVLRELGFDDVAIEALRTDEVIPSGE